MVEVDSVSASISVSSQVSMVRYVTQSIFLFMLSIVSTISILFDYGNKDLWLLILVLCISQILNLPMPAVINMVKADKIIKDARAV